MHILAIDLKMIVSLNFQKCKERKGRDSVEWYIISNNGNMKKLKLYIEITQLEDDKRNGWYELLKDK